MRFLPGCGLTVLLVWSCDHAPTIAVGRMGSDGTDPNSESGSGYDCSVEMVKGPAGYDWCPYVDEGTTGHAQWGETTPTETSVSFLANSPEGARAGLAFRFPNGESQALGAYSRVTLDMDITNGSSFELVLGRTETDGIERSCSYVFAKSENGQTYGVDLNNPVWCVPSQCGFDLRSTGGLSLAPGGDASSLEATVKDVRFENTGVSAGNVSAMQSAIGPGELCWFLVGWKLGGDTRWIQGVTSTMAYGHAVATGGVLTGMAFEVPTTFADGSSLAAKSRIVIHANVTVASPSSSFLVRGVNAERGLVWQVTPQTGFTDYTINLSAPNSVFPEGSAPLGLGEIKRFEITLPVGVASELDVNVADVRFIQ